VVVLGGVQRLAVAVQVEATVGGLVEGVAEHALEGPQARER
jgi:hypothetical protein